MALVDVSRFLPNKQNAIAIVKEAPPPVPVDTSNMVDDMRAVYEERDQCREAGDVQGEASALLTVAEMHANEGSYFDAIAKAKEASELCRAVGETEGQAAALQMSIQLHLADSRHEEALILADQALPLLQKLEDTHGEANLALLTSQAYMQFVESGDGSNSAWEDRRKALASANKAVKLARAVDDLDILCSSLCMQSQACCANLHGPQAVDAANEALLLYRSVGDRHGEAYAHVLSANAFVVKRLMQKAYQSASQGLFLFRRLEDSWGITLAETTLEAIEGKKRDDTEELDAGPMEALEMGPAGGESNALSDADLAVMRNTVRSTVTDIVGMDEVADDTPLMNLGLTSQQAVLLRNSLQKNLPGPSLPFTMMFDHPNVQSLTEFFVRRAG
jgi:tetratricopeptide (TPR) repeat protein